MQSPSSQVQPRLQCVVRFRPPRRPSQQSALLTCRPPCVVEVLSPNLSCREHTFDVVYDQETSQETCFMGSVMPLVKALLHGRSSTVLVCGGLGSGRRFTVEGNAAQPGLLPLAVTSLWQRITPDHRIRVSWFEIMGDDLNDLFGHGHQRSVLEDGRVDALRKCTVDAPSDVFRLINTVMLDVDRECHTVFTLYLQLPDTPGRAKRATTSDVGLKALKRVAECAYRGPGIAPPYHASTLTRILQPCLERDDHEVLIVGTMGTMPDNYNDAVHTMRLLLKLRPSKGGPRVTLPCVTQVPQQLVHNAAKDATPGRSSTVRRAGRLIQRREHGTEVAPVTPLHASVRHVSRDNGDSATPTNAEHVAGSRGEREAMATELANARRMVQQLQSEQEEAAKREGVLQQRLAQAQREASTEASRTQAAEAALASLQSQYDAIAAQYHALQQRQHRHADNAPAVQHALELEQELTRVRAQLVEAKHKHATDVDHIQAQAKLAQDSLSKAMAELEAASTAEQRAKQAEQLLREARQRCQQYEEEAVRIRAELHSARQGVSRLRALVRDQGSPRRVSATVEAEPGDASTELVVLRRRLQKAQAQADEWHKDASDAMQARVAALTQGAAHRAQLEAQVKAAVTRAEQLHAEAKQWRQRANDVTAKLQQLQERHSDAEARAATAQQGYEAMKRQAEEASTKARSRKEALVRARSDAHRVSTEAQQRVEQCQAAAATERKDAARTVELLRGQVAQLQAQVHAGSGLEQAQQRVADLEQQLRQQRASEMESVRHEQQRSASLQEALGTAQARLEAAQAETGRCREQVSTAVAEAERCRQAVTALQSKVHEAEEGRSAAVARAEEAEGARGRAEARLLMATSREQEWRDRCQAAEQQLGQANADAELREEKLSLEVDAALAVANELRVQLDDKTKLLLAADALNAECERELTRKSGRLAQLRTTLNDLLAQVETAVAHGTMSMPLTWGVATPMVSPSMSQSMPPTMTMSKPSSAYSPTGEFTTSGHEGRQLYGEWDVQGNDHSSSTVSDDEEQ